jgi:hypothetical protein
MKGDNDILIYKCGKHTSDLVINFQISRLELKLAYDGYSHLVMSIDAHCKRHNFRKDWFEQIGVIRNGKRLKRWSRGINV